MKNVSNKETLDSANSFLENTLTNLDLNLEMEKIYKIINDEKLQDEYEREIKLNNLRNDNYKRYNDIKILKYKELSQDFDDITEDILKLYESINIKNILTDDYENSKNNKIILDNIYRRISRLDSMIKSYLKEITKDNDEKQNKFSIVYFKTLDIDERLRKELIEKYNDLVIHSSSISQDLYQELNIQQKRKEYICEILSLLNIESNSKLRLLNKDRLYELNKKINIEIIKYNEKIQYLEDLIPEESRYREEFNNFKMFYNKLIAYDDTDYENACQTYEILSDELKFKNFVNSFESLFLNEINDRKKEEKFIYEKIGIKNLKISLNYIMNNYMDKISSDDKVIVKYVFDKLNSGNYNLQDLNKSLSIVVKNIWIETITNVYSYDEYKNYYFICSNNQFRDARYQTILITRDEINKVDDYNDYQIGFICGYNDNIMYITENEDIMTVNNDDMSNLKTPLQLEEEFINFKVCNRIALNGYKTRIEAVYFINDGNKEKYIKAIELANMYKLPLIELKKDIH